MKIFEKKYLKNFFLENNSGFTINTQLKLPEFNNPLEAGEFLIQLIQNHSSGVFPINATDSFSEYWWYAIGKDCSCQKCTFAIGVLEKIFGKPENFYGFRCVKLERLFGGNTLWHTFSLEDLKRECRQKGQHM